MKRQVLLAVMATLVVAACGSDPGANPETTTTTAQATTTTPTTVPIASTTTVATPTTTTVPPDSTTTTVDEATAIVIHLAATGPEVSVDGLPIDLRSRVEVGRGNLVRIVTTGEVTDEVHIHTYDLRVEVSPGDELVLEFVADIAAIVEVELEGAHSLLFRLVVS